MTLLGCAELDFLFHFYLIIQMKQSVLAPKIILCKRLQFLLPRLLSVWYLQMGSVHPSTDTGKETV